MMCDMIRLCLSITYLIIHAKQSFLNPHERLVLKTLLVLSMIPLLSTNYQCYFPMKNKKNVSKSMCYGFETQNNLKTTNGR